MKSMINCENTHIQHIHMKDSVNESMRRSEKQTKKKQKDFQTLKEMNDNIDVEMKISK